MKMLKKLLRAENAAQIILVAIFLPIFAFSLAAISRENEGLSNVNELLKSLIDAIPVCEVCANLLCQFWEGLSVGSVMSLSVSVLLKAFPEAIISIICVHGCCQLFNKKNVRGLPIFPTFLGIFIATVITVLTGLSGSDFMQILVEFGVIIIILIGLKLVFKSAFGGAKIFSIKKILILIIDGLFAVLSTTYVAGLLLAAQGEFGAAKDTFVKVLILAATEILGGYLVVLVKKGESSDGII